MKPFTLSLTMAVAFTGLVSALPAQAATRNVELPASIFADRCDKHSGILSVDGNIVHCQTPTVPVACAYVDVNKAQCRWPGIDNQIAVNRVIGLPSATPLSIASGGGTTVGKGGGLFGPGDLVNPDNDGPNWQGPKDFQANW